MVCSRVRELHEALSAATIALEISSRNARIQALPKRWDRLRAHLDLSSISGARTWRTCPAAPANCCVGTTRARKPTGLVTRIDHGVVLLVAELRSHERQAAEELGQWKTHHEERKPLDASPAAITLALLLTDEELDSLEKRAGDGEIAGRGRPGGSDVASPQPAARHGEPAQVFAATAAAPDGRPRMDGVIGCRQASPFNSRVAALQKRWDRLRAGLDLILDQRGADMADIPGGASGLLVRDYKGKEADRLVTRIDPGVGLAGRRTARPRAPGRRGSRAVEGWWSME